jgi:hypothetical protein
MQSRERFEVGIVRAFRRLEFGCHADWMNSNDKLSQPNAGR